MVTVSAGRINGLPTGTTSAGSRGEHASAFPSAAARDGRNNEQRSGIVRSASECRDRAFFFHEKGLEFGLRRHQSRCGGPFRKFKAVKKNCPGKPGSDLKPWPSKPFLFFEPCFFIPSGTDFVVPHVGIQDVSVSRMLDLFRLSFMISLLPENYPT